MLCVKCQIIDVEDGSDTCPSCYIHKRIHEDDRTMKVFTCNSFNGHWSVGTVAVIVAETQVQAFHYLIDDLVNNNLPQDNLTLDEVEELPMIAGVTILNDGDY